MEHDLDVDPRELMWRELLEIREGALETAITIKNNILSFTEKVMESREGIVSGLEKIKAYPTKNLDGALVVDPLNKLFSIIKIQPLSEEEAYPKVYFIRMEPPYIPHFFLTVGYIYLRTGLVPAGLLRTEPVLSLIMLMTRGDVFTATMAQLTASVALIEKFFTEEVTILPLIPGLIDLPIETSDIYLTSLGYSTTPFEGLGYCIRVDLSSLPNIPEELYSKLNFRSYREVLDEVIEKVIL